MPRLDRMKRPWPRSHTRRMLSGVRRALAASGHVSRWPCIPWLCYPSQRNVPPHLFKEKPENPENLQSGTETDTFYVHNVRSKAPQLTEPDAPVEELLELGVVCRHPDDPVVLVDDFVGSFEVVQNLLERLVLHPFGEGPPELCPGRVLRLLELVHYLLLDHQHRIQFG